MKSSGNLQIQQFAVSHDAVVKAIDEGSILFSVGTDELDTLVSQDLNNSPDIMAAPREAKGVHFVFRLRP